jgi:predicted DNA-binding transcriptional regulator YafY
MRFVDKKLKLDYLIALIENENTGTATDLCFDIRVSRSTLKRYLNDLRKLGYQIAYLHSKANLLPY